MRRARRGSKRNCADKPRYANCQVHSLLFRLRRQCFQEGGTRERQSSE
jgi:hypothetical protein